MPAGDQIDTKLARLLHERGRVALPVLQRALEGVRGRRGVADDAALAESLVGMGILSRGEVQQLLAQLGHSSARLSKSQSGDRLASSLIESQEEQRAAWREGGQIGPYLLLSKLGQGGMGIVFRARHRESGREVALKGLAVGGDDSLLRRFTREAQAQAQVDDHPYVARIRESGSAAGYVYLAMDLLEGGDLGQRLRRGRLEQAEAASLVARLAQGVAHCHARGILHRDLKPGNVLFDDEGRPKLVDFGLARLEPGRSSLTKTGELLGTPAYMAPEQALGDPDQIDERSDVYALGAILYHCLTGERTFRGASTLEVLSQVVTEEPPAPSRLAPVDPALEVICLRALAKDRAERYPSAAALAEALAEWEAGQAPPPARAGGAIALGGALLLALALAGAALAYHQGRAAGSAAAGPTPSVTPSAAEQGPRFRARVGQRFALRLDYRAEAEAQDMGTLPRELARLLDGDYELERVFGGEVRAVEPEVELELRLRAATLRQRGVAGEFRVDTQAAPQAFPSGPSIMSSDWKRYLEDATLRALRELPLRLRLHPRTGAVLGLEGLEAWAAAAERLEASVLPRLAPAAPHRRVSPAEKLRARLLTTRLLNGRPYLERTFDLVFHLWPAEPGADPARGWRLAGREPVQGMLAGWRQIPVVSGALTDHAAFDIGIERLRVIGPVGLSERRVRCERAGADDYRLTWRGSDGMRPSIRLEASTRQGWPHRVSYRQEARLVFLTKADEERTYRVVAQRRTTLELEETP